MTATARIIADSMNRNGQRLTPDEATSPGV